MGWRMTRISPDLYPPWPERSAMTEQLALAKTVAATLPARSRRSPVHPCVPIAIRSAPITSAIRTISVAALPSLVRYSTSSGWFGT